MNREELALEQQHLDLTEALDAAKANYNGEEIGPTQKALKDAEWALTDFRMKWRDVRTAFAQASEIPEGHGVAQPEPLAVTMKGAGIPANVTPLEVKPPKPGTVN